MNGLIGMNTKKKCFAPKKRLIKHFLSLTLAGSLLLPGLVLIRTETVQANIIVDMASGVVGKIRYNTTVAELIVSLLTGSGASISNTQWLNQLNNAYGVESTLATATGTDGTIGAMYEAGLFSVDSAGHFVDNGLADAIRNVPEYSSMGISDVFATTSTDMELGAWQIADGATNIGEAASSGIKAGTIGQAVGALSMGVHLGVLANKFCEKFGSEMRYGLLLNQNVNTSNLNIPSGKYFCQYATSPNSTIYKYSLNTIAYDPQIIPYLSIVGSEHNYMVVEGYYNTQTQSYGYLRSASTQSGSPVEIAPNPTTQNSIAGNKYISPQVYRYVYGFTQSGYNVQYFATNTDYSNWVNAINNHQTTPTGETGNVYSPDVITSSGNARYDPNDNTNNGFPTVRPIDELTQPVNNEDTGIKPIPWNDYTDFAQTVNNNTENNITNNYQGDVYNNFVTNYITQPQITETVETPDYNPTVPEQPIPNTKPTNTPETNQSNTDYMTTPGLKDVFPFCIPWDIAALFGSFGTIEREAPVVTFPIVSNLFGIDEEVTLDLSPYDDVAALLRTLELIGFGIALAFVTRYLIGAGS